MESPEAREHLRMVDSILRTTDRSVRMPPAILVGVGAICSLETALMQAQQAGWSLPAEAYLQPIGLVLVIAVIVVTAWRERGKGRQTLLDGYTGAAFFAAAAFGLVLNLTAQHRVIPAEGIGLVWAGSFSMALLITGAMGSRVLFCGGLAMLAAVGAAGLMRPWLFGMVSVAWFVGFVIPGLVLALAKRHG